jgi:putative hemolysin
LTETTLLVVAIVLLLLGNGFFSGSEIAILSVRRSRIETLAAEGRRAARRVKRLQDDPDTLLATAQIGVTLLGTLAGMLGGYLASRHVEPLVSATGIGRWVGATLVSTILVGAGIVYIELVVGELVPKALALRFREPIALLVSWPLALLAQGSRGVIAVLTASTHGILRLLRVSVVGPRTFVSEDEIKHLVKEGRDQGVLDQNKVELIHGVFEFSEAPVRSVMVPRPKMFALDAATPPGEVERLIVESGFSRIPAYDGSVDNIVGLVYAKDALRLLERRQPVVLRQILHPAYFVPDSKKVGLLLRDLQKRRTHMAVVIDEHGSVTGLVTLEDLLEEIVGEIQDEYDWEERAVERLKDGSLVVEGTVSASELRDVFHVPIPDSTEFQTVAGYVLDCLGSVPKGGEVVGAGDYRLTVVDVEKNRISKVKIEKAREVAVPGS